MSSQFDGCEPWQGRIEKRQNGAIVSDREGDVVAYACFYCQERGCALREAGRPGVRGDDRGRAQPRQRPRLQHLQGEEAHEHPRRGPRRERILTPPRDMSLETALEWIAEDELVEVTPESRSACGRSSSTRTPAYKLERDRKKGTRRGRGGRKGRASASAPARGYEGPGPPSPEPEHLPERRAAADSRSRDPDPDPTHLPGPGRGTPKRRTRPGLPERRVECGSPRRR